VPRKKAEQPSLLRLLESPAQAAGLIARLKPGGSGSIAPPRRKRPPVRVKPVQSGSPVHKRSGVYVDWATLDIGPGGELFGGRLAPFLEAFAGLGQMRQAAEKAGLSCREVALARRMLPGFERAFQELRMLQLDIAEDELYRRGVTGWDEPVYHRGEVVGAVRRYSDACLTYMLRCRRPEVYNPQAGLDHTGSDGSMAPERVQAPSEEAVEHLNRMYADLKGEAAERGEDADGSKH
jgi:hypothetical protein